MTQERRGAIKKYDSARGFGFIRPANGDRDLFFHMRAVPRGLIPEEGVPVSYDVETGQDGRFRAVNVRPALAVIEDGIG